MKKTIDLEGTLEKRWPRLREKLPFFVIRFLKKILHQDFLNQKLDQYSHLKGLDFIDAIFKELNVTTEVRGQSASPELEPAIFVANHPQGALDGLAFIAAVSRHFGPAKILVNDVLMLFEPLRPLFVPIARFGNKGREDVARLSEVLRSTEHLLIFPAGSVSKLRWGRARDRRWGRLFVKLAIRHQRPVVPVHIRARNSWFFYALAFVRKWLGLRANLEMFLLADEMLKQRGKSLTLTVGDKIPWSRFDQSRDREDWAQWVRSQVYGLA